MRDETAIVLPFVVGIAGAAAGVASSGLGIGTIRIRATKHWL
jgi:hypothetical protein